MKLPRNIDDVFPTTPLQTGMLFHDIQSDDRTMYMQQYCFEVDGAFKPKDFIYAWTKVLRRHPSLRTSFRWEGLSQSVQLIHKRVSLPCYYADISQMDKQKQKEYINTLVTHDREKGFKLITPPLTRFSLIKLGNESWYMILSFHHIVADGWSIGLLFRDFYTCWQYKETRGSLTSAIRSLNTISTPSMKEYVSHANKREKKSALTWWTKQLGEARQQPLPFDSPTILEKPTIVSTSRATIDFSTKQTRELNKAVKRDGLTMNVYFQASWALTMAAFTGKNDILFAVSSASRPGEVADVGNIFGPLLNVWPLRISVTKKKVSDFLKQVGNSVFGALENDHIPLTELKDMITENDPEGFLNTMTVFENLPSGTAPEINLLFRPNRTFEKTSYPLTLLGYPGENLSFDLIYDSDRFTQAQATALLSAMKDCMLSLGAQKDIFIGSVIREIAPSRAKGDIAVLRGAKRDYLLLDAWKQFEGLAKKTPEAPAFMQVDPTFGRYSNTETIPDNLTVSYKTLLGRVLHIASLLNAMGFNRQDMAAIRLETGVDQFAAMLAVWRLGGIWLPIPPVYPQRQSQLLLNDSEAKVLISTSVLAGGLIKENTENSSSLRTLLLDTSGHTDPGGIPDYVTPKPDRTACIVYTSGSTGRPKGVRLSHAGLSNRFQWMWQDFPFKRDERVCAKTTTAFVDFIWETFGGLLAGVPVVLPTTDQAKDPDILSRIVASYKVSRLILTPSFLAVLLGMEGATTRLTSVRLLALSGEALVPKQAEQILDVLPKTRLLNIYGSTEVTADTTFYEITPAVQHKWKNGIPLGVPIANTVAAIVDENGQPQSKGKKGELVITGACLSSGYHNDLEMTEETYVPFPALSSLPELELPEETLWFKTGDIGIISSDELIRYQGRRDMQIKVRGIRVEPETATRLLEGHPMVKEAFVRAMPDKAGQKRLAAFICPAGDENEDSVTGELVEHWRSLYDDLYAKIAKTSNITSDFHIWVSSYDGSRIPQAEMEECMNEAVRTIRTLKPKKLLEIGCGQGFILFPLAPECTSYMGLDNSKTVLKGLAEHFSSSLENGRVRSGHITLQIADADALPYMEEEKYDTIVYNSVVQYFPNQEYLKRSLGQVIAHTAPNGRIYLGDVRNLDVQDYFRLSLLLHEHKTNGANLPAVDILSRMSIASHSEGELLVSPDFFRNLPNTFDRVAGVVAQPKRGHADNELSAFRYEVVLYLDTFPVTEYIGDEIQWNKLTDEKDFPAFIGATLQKTDKILVRGIPQKRLLPFLNFENALDTAVSAGKMYAPTSSLIKESPVYTHGFTREELHELATSMGCEMDIHFSEDGVAMDAIFRSPQAPTMIPARAGASQSKDQPVINAPTKSRFETSLKKILSDYLEESLSGPMRPEALLFSDSWPKTISGKLDLKRLPNPFLKERKTAGGKPRSGFENELAQLWKQTLGVKQVGRQDNFFELGGNSLSITQLAFTLRRTLDRDIGLRELYQVPFLKDMAAYLEGESPDTVVLPESKVAMMSLEPDRLEKDIHLADAYSPSLPSVPRPITPNTHILVTGAPGLIGLWLLSKLLTIPGVQIQCLAEPQDMANARGSEKMQLISRMKAAGCWNPQYSNSLSVLPGHVGLESFGLSNKVWEQLSDITDVVVHSGLLVNLAQSYGFLRAFNVKGTAEVIRFCCTGEAKPLHFVSSLSVIDHTAWHDLNKPVKEDAPLDSYSGLPGGYTLARWVMDHMIRRASARGLQTAIYRFNTVSGDSKTHKCDTSEIYWRLLRYCCQTGALPEGKRKVDLTPVDTAVDMVLSIASSNACYNKVYHICNPNPEPWTIWERYLRRLGHDITTIPALEWVKKLRHRPESEHDDNSKILLSMSSKDGYDPVQPLQISMQNTLAALDSKGISIPRFSFGQFKACHDAMIKEGWLPAPTGESKEQLQTKTDVMVN